MKILREDFNEIEIDKSLIKEYSYDFIEKYQIIPYSKTKESIIYLIKENYNLFDLIKAHYFSNKQLIYYLVDQNTFERIINILCLSYKQEKAMIGYQNKEDKAFILNDDVNIFYQADVANAPIVKFANSIIEEAISIGASDLHIEPFKENFKIRLRIDGKLFDKNSYAINSYNELITRVKIMASLDITKKYIPQDGKINYKFNNKDFDIRVSCLPTIYGERVALRILDKTKKEYDLESLNFTDMQLHIIKNLIKVPNGMIIVAGPTGAGKSTTLYSFIMNSNFLNDNIITVEDPVEYSMTGVSQVQVNEIAGLNFATCLKSILRQDPNVIMIGEMRDLETAQIACRAAITGHLVYSTLHTNSALGVITRLLDMNIEPFMLSASLRGIVYQRLLRKLCNKCKKKIIINKNDASLLNMDENSVIYSPCGCGYCHSSGYYGRFAVHEVVNIDENISNMINNSSCINKIKKELSKRNFETLQSICQKCLLSGITSIEEVKSILE